MAFKAEMENTVILWFMCENRACKYFSDLFPFFLWPCCRELCGWNGFFAYC